MFNYYPSLKKVLSVCDAFMNGKSINIYVILNVWKTLLNILY